MRLLRNNIVKQSIKALVSGLLIFVLLRRIGVGMFWDLLTRADIAWLQVGVGVMLVSNILGAMQWHLILKSRGIAFSFPRVLHYYFVGLFFNSFLVGNFGGDVFRVYDAGRRSGQVGVAISTVFFDRLLGFSALAAMALASSLTLFDVLLDLNAVWFAGIILAFIGGALFVLFHMPTAERVRNQVKHLMPESVYQKLREAYFSLHSIRQERKLLAGLFLLAFVVQSLRILTHYSAARAVGVSVSPGYFLIFIPIVALLANLPISIGGLGVREQSAVVLFAAAGAAASKVVTFEFIAYLVGVGLSVPGGILFATRNEKRGVTDSVLERASESIPNAEGGDDAFE